MTELSKLLEENGIRKAVIIDDVFDAEPRPGDLGAGDWSNFFDDLGEDGAKLLTELYPEYEDTPTDDLKISQEFISIVWENREGLPPVARDALFRKYKNTNDIERKTLDSLVTALRNLELTCTTIGRDLNEEARGADLIIVDLFLEDQLSEDDIDRAVLRVKELTKDRQQNPPLVVLMSRSSQLEKRRNDFRDDAGLLGSTFRVVIKANLIVPGVLERLLRKLVDHYEDAKRIVRFVDAWSAGLDRARKNFIKVLRRLDLSDLAQIQALLLEFEEQKLGEYLLDVADGVLQHEIEGDNSTIGAALELNKIDLTKHPAPHLAGTPDLQELVYRMVFIHSDRLRLSKNNGRIQLQFGDLLCWKDKDGTALSDDVSLVITPACDLVRRGVERVMLLSGNLRNLEPKSWSYQGRPVRTAIVTLPDGSRKWIKWNLKDVKTLSWSELDDLFDGLKGLIRIGRLRELYAIEIQQIMLADFGRIGRPANLPAPFPVDVSLFYVDADSKAQKLDIKEIEPATCYVGRDANSKPIHRLVLTEQACDHIERALRSLDPGKLHQSTQSSLDAVKAGSGFFDRLERGEIEIPLPDRKEKMVQDANSNVHAAIIRDEGFDEGSTVSGNRQRAALIIKVLGVEGDDETGHL